MHIWVSPEEIKPTLAFRSELVDEDWAARLAETWLAVLRGVVSHSPSARLDELLEHKRFPDPGIHRTSHQQLPDKANARLERGIIDRPLLNSLGEIWQEVLGPKPVHPRSDFFASGGDSLQAVRLISLIKKHHEVSVPVNLLFANPVFEIFAGQVAGMIADKCEVDDGLAVVAGPSPNLEASYGQRRMWILHQLDDSGCVYNTATAWRLRGNLNLTALWASIREIVERHEALRTVFKMDAGHLIQEVCPASEFDIRSETGTNFEQNVPGSHSRVNLLEPGGRHRDERHAPTTRFLHFADLSGLAATEQGRQLDEMLADARGRKFDLAQGPLFNASCLRLSEKEHVLQIILHHITFDGWSMGVLARELSTLYAAFSQGRPNPLGPMTIQYSDFSRWQHQLLAGERIGIQLSYWKEKLADTLTVLDLPSDRPRQPSRTNRGKMQSLVIPAPLVQSLRALGKKDGATLFMTLLAVLKVICYRHTGQTDIIVGTPSTGRVRPETENLIGFLLNHLALRTDASGEPTFRELLVRVRTTAMEAFAHQDLPFEMLVEELRIERDPIRTPIFQIYFNMLTLEDNELSLQNIDIDPLTPANQESNFDCTFYVRERDENLVVHLSYNSDLFDDVRMKAMLAQYESLLQQVVTSPDRPIGSFSLTPSEVGVELPNPSQPLCADWVGSIHSIFDQMARHRPSQLAIVDSTDSWTYRELESRSNQLAHALMAEGVESRDVVAVFAHRSASLVWALLGILKSGAAFVILDPAHPATRLLACLEASGARAFISLEAAGPLPGELIDGLGQLDLACHFDLPRLAELETEHFLATFSTTPPVVDVGPDSLAYISFTSGSTGKPKGVCGRHGPLSHFLPWQIDRFNLTHDDHFCLLSGLAHDPLHRDVFTPLAVGATLCIPEPPILQGSGLLADWMLKQGITFAHLTPAMGSILAEAAESHSHLRELRYVYFIGDTLSTRDVDRLRKIAPGVTCLNAYGSTETQRAVSFHVIPPETDLGTADVALPLGWGMPNVQLLILNKAGHIAGIGELGEIHIRSPHLARGHLNDSALTEARFLPNPFSDDPTDRLYRTGDLGRYLPDGNAEFAGRVDRQTKIRGFRIELGEIETALGDLPAVTQSLVVLSEDVAEQRQLIAYCVGPKKWRPSVASLREHLQSRLPDYMVPSAFVILDALPLTPSGKVDRQALPAPDALQGHDTAYVAPRSIVEQELASIWCDILDIEKVGIHHRFFDVGGHSLLAIRVLARVAAVLQVELPMSLLFEAPTIAKIAVEIEVARSGGNRARPTAITPFDRKPSNRLPLSFAQQRLWILEQVEGNLTAYNMPRVWRLRGTLNVEGLGLALEALVHRHESLRTNIVMDGGVPKQVIREACRFKLPVIPLKLEKGEEREAEVCKLASLEADRPFDLETDFPLRAQLLGLDEDEHVLLLTQHHISGDAWSTGVLMRDLGAFYTMSCAGNDLNLPALTIQYADYAVWQRQELKGERLGMLLDYWREQLDGMDSLELPMDRQRPLIPSYRGANFEFEVPAALVDRLTALGRDDGTSLQMTLLAAFQILLSRYSGQEDVAVGTPVAGRNQSELEDQIGFFVNTLILRTDLSGQPTFRELLSRVREVSLGAYDHQDLPFEKLVEELQPERNPTRNPLVDVLFQLLNLTDTELRLKGLEVSRETMSSEQARFELEIHFLQKPTGLSCQLVYRTDLFESSTIERMANHLLVLLNGIVTDPDQRIGELPMLTEGERHQLLVEWNDTKVEFPVKCVQEFFEEQVEMGPDAIALVFGDKQLSYRDLNEQANQLAHHLRNQGAGPETRVGLCLERSPDLAIGILGILKSGAAYVPLDPEFPRQRLEFILRDARVENVVTQNRLRTLIGAEGINLICVDANDTRLEENERENPAFETDAGSIAYILFTSGSTGRPKGVAMPHRALSNLIEWHRRHPRLGQPSRTLQFASATFDVSFQEMLSTWACGGTLVLVDKETRRDPNALLRYIADEQVERIFVPYVALQQLAIGFAGVNGGLPLRDIVSAGEVLHLTPEIQHLLGSTDDCWLHNHYGPTESHVVTSLVLDCEVEGLPGECLIGKPLANTQIYLLDEEENPVPIGVPGELYIGGAGLAHGYLRSALTSERFVANPFADDPNSRLYRTGDQCRWRADGNLEFLGRLDDQLKLRGFRIEPGEIESVLNNHSGVSQSVVILREDHPDDKRLVACFVPGAGWKFDQGKLRDHVRRDLPEYMVPSAFVQLDKIPLTISGKVARRSLPIPDALRPEMNSDCVAPRTMVEEKLSEVWQEFLGVERVGIHDDFFKLGGHSLVAIRVNARISSELQINLQVSSLFEAPTIAGLADKIEELRRGGVGMSSLPLVRVARDSACGMPLSFSQQRLWFIEQLEGELTAYNMSFGWRIRGDLDAEALRRAFEKLVNRYEVLRTNFAMVDGEPVQVFGEEVKFDLPVVDLTLLEPEAQEGEVSRLWRKEAECAFDLGGDLMLRASLLRLSKNEHVLLFVMHHIASDGWSLEILRRELGTLYDANCRGEDAGLFPLTIQYADFAVWQRQALKGSGRLEDLLTYWRGQLSSLEALELPTDRSRPLVPSYRGARHEFEISRNLTGRLKALGESSGATLQMTLLAAFQVLLSRYSGQDDIAVGTPIAGRNHADLEGQIGFFVNTLVLRTDLSGEPTFLELLGRIREVSLGAYDHEDLPFEKLVEEVQPERDLSRSPLFQVVFQLINFSDDDLQLEDLEVLRLPSRSERVHFDLEMNLRQLSEKLSGVIVFSTDLFDAVRIERMVGHFLILLEGIVTDPNQCIGELPMLTEGERHQLLVEWNDTTVEYPARGVHELFEEQVEKSPDAVALVFEGSKLTYGELNERANRLAHCLIKKGVGPDVMVGICVERSFEMIVGLLGILKAGGAYVPLDPNYPEARLAFMLEDCGKPLLLTSEERSERFEGLTGDLLFLNDDLAPAGQPVENPGVSIESENLAYVVYTSGSTGRPKGVEIPHRGVVRLVCEADYCQFNRDRVFLQFAPLSFDAATFETWGALLNGARLVLAPSGRDAMDRIPELISQHGITTAWLTAGLFNQFVDRDPGILSGLEELLIGGEALSPQHVSKAISALPGIRIINGYGPTENTTFSSTFHIESCEDQSAISIGRPITNSRVYILNDALHLLPIGVAGELSIGGDGLARSYLNRPELTAERFVEIEIPGRTERVYRTGDLCRWKSDGNLEFLGRLDHQVKIRGFRIELGEIEAELGGYPGIKECVVLIREVTPGEEVLVAYFVPNQKKSVTTRDLRRALLERLPDYMIPFAFVPLDALPLTSNGKLDRKALPTPELDRASVGVEYTAPRTRLEEELALIWNEVFGINRVGIHDNFFELGGHSLVAIRVMARIATELQVELSVRSLFEAPTIAGLAGRIEHAQGRANQSRPKALAPVDRDQVDRLPLSFAQQRLWFLEQMDEGLTAYNMSFGWRVRGLLDLSRLARAVTSLVGRHEVLRTTFTQDNGDPFQVIGDVENFDIQLVDLSALGEEERESELVRTGREEAEAPFDLERDLMLRMRVLRMSNEEHVLFLTMHHIASDGWSIEILWRELSEFYAADLGGREPVLPELVVQYSDYAFWQREQLNNQRIQTLLDYWTTRLYDIPPALELPLDFPRGRQQTYCGGRQNIIFDSKLTKQIKDLGQEVGATNFMTLLAVFQLLLSRLSGQDIVVIGAPVAGRLQTEVESLIGLFLNNLVLRGNLGGNPSFRELLMQIRSTVLEAHDYDDLPFEQLVQALQPEQDLNRTPLFQVLFNGVEFKGSELDIQDTRVERLDPGESIASKYDLTVYLRGQGAELSLSLVYNVGLFCGERMEEVGRQFTSLVSQIAGDPDRGIDSYSLITSESGRVLPDPCEPLESSCELTVVAQIEAWAERAPDQVAIQGDTSGWSYGKLATAIRRFSATLTEAGVGEGAAVALLGDRSFGFFVGLLGILKSGAVAVPLDPSLPKARIEVLMEEVEVRLVVIIGENADEVATSHFGSPHIRVSATTGCAEPGPNIEVEGGTRSIVGSRPVGASTIFFTSGTTGTPKGVLGSHQALSHFVNWQRAEFEVGPGDRVAQVTGTSFDVMLREAFLPLTSGATLCLPEEHLDEGAGFWRWLEDRKITILHSVPSRLESWLAELPDGLTLDSIRWLFMAGEPLTDILVGKWRESSSGEMVNLYGTTETGPAKLWYQVPSDGKLRQGVQPLGNPLPQSQVLIMSDGNRLCGIGELGEIVLRSPYLALGYLRSEATQKRFVGNPFGAGEGDVLYRSGDLGRYLPDGQVEIAGRRDDQVKVRGVRVEPAEISAVLGTVTGVVQCFVGVINEGAKMQLVAWVLPEEGSGVTGRTLRQSLEGRLPQSMVPNHFVLVGHLPLTASGKVNRRELPQPESQNQIDIVSPRTPLEEALAAIWCDVLDIDRIGIHDNFFGIGGHSLLAMRLISKIRKVLDVEIPLRTFFENPTIELLGLLIFNTELSQLETGGRDMP